MAGKQTITISVLADTKNFASAMKRMKDDPALGGLPKIGTAIAKGMKAAAVGVVGVGVALAGLATKGGISRYLAIDESQAKLRGLGYTTQQISGVMDDALSAVRGTAFGLGDAVTVSTGMLAAGVKPGQDLANTVRLIGDAATIGGAELSEMGSIFSKVAANGKLSMGEVNQLADRGIPVLASLADHFGVTQAEASKMVSQGKVDFAAFSAAMDSTLGGAALASGDTFKGAMANAQAALGRLGEQIVAPVFDELKVIFQDSIPAIDEFAAAIQPAVEEFASNLGPAIQTAKDGFSEFAAVIRDDVLPNVQGFFEWLNANQDVLTPLAVGLGVITAVLYAKAAALYVAGVATAAWTSVTNAARAAQLLFNASLLANPIVLVITLIAALVAGLVYFFTQTETGRRAWATFTGFLKSAWDVIVKFFDTTLTNVKRWFSDAGKNVQGAWEAVSRWFSELPGKIGRFFAGAATLLLTAGRAILDGLRNGATAAWATVNGWFGGIPGRILSALGDAGRILLGAGKAIIDGFLGGLKASWKGVTDFVGGIASWIAANKGPLSYDRGLLKPAGKAIMGGFLSSLQDAYQGVQGFVAGIGPDLADGIATVPFDVAAVTSRGGTVNVYQFDGLSFEAATDDEARVLDEFVKMARRKARAGAGV